MKNRLRAHLFNDAEYWRARGDRAIAKSLLAANTALIIKRTTLETSRSTIRILAATPGRDDAYALRLADRVARYFVHEAELERRVTELGRRLDRCSLTR